MGIPDQHSRFGDLRLANIKSMLCINRQGSDQIFVVIGTELKLTQLLSDFMKTAWK